MSQHSDHFERTAPRALFRGQRSLERHSKLNYCHWLILAISLVLTLSAWQYSRYQVALRADARFNNAANQIAELIEERLQKYELALQGGVAALKTHDNDVDRQTWRMFAQKLQIEATYPGIHGIGVIHHVSSSNLQSYLESQRRELPEFRIHPSRKGEFYLPITFIEPFERNAPAVGLDMMHEQNRKTSILNARDTGNAQITGPIVLVQGNQVGFLFFAPFYYRDRDETLQMRREHFSGAVYAPIVVSELIHGVLHKDRRSISIRISDGDEIIYDEIDDTESVYDAASFFEKSIALPLYGREWKLDIRAGQAFRGENSNFEPLAILLLGIFVDLALLGFFTFLARANRRSLNYAKKAAMALRSEKRALQALRAEKSSLQVSNQELAIAMREAESAIKLKSNFLSMMSHEIRTPLSAISGILDLLLATGLSEKQGRLVETGKMASKNLLKLLNDVLDSSRLEAGALELWEREVDLRQVFEEWKALAEGAVRNFGKDINIVAEIEGDIPSKVVLDDIRLSQVMNNLIDNAIRFTECGRIEIRALVSLDRLNQSPSIVISISDTGIGIEEKSIAVIFERFRQVEGAVTRTRGGSGLGLSICRDIIQLMGGKIRVSSKLGKGTQFEIQLPLRELTT